MSLFSACTRLLLLVPLALWLTGCFQMNGGPEDEEKDPYYQLGQNRYAGMDYEGAIAAFENALISNPKSAAAHLQLGYLYEDKKPNYAAAIYHFQKHLQLKPKTPQAAIIQQRIMDCEMRLAENVPFALVSGRVQDEIRRMNSTNLAQAAEIERLKAELIQQSLTFSNRLAALTQVSFPTQVQAQIPLEPEHHPAPGERPPSPVGSNSASHSSTLPRTHLVRGGETLAKIARKYNIKLSALQAANPRVEATRLRPGQVLNLPSPRS
jgi:tetratricopeptide (TPR) repeat protein